MKTYKFTHENKCILHLHIHFYIISSNFLHQVDKNLTPWLLEVNRCPSLSYDCDVDRVVKKPLLHHLFDLVGPPKVIQSMNSPIKGPNPLVLQSALRKEGISLDKPQKENVCRFKRSNLCEDCDGGFRKKCVGEKRSLIRRKNSQSLALLKWRDGLRNSKSVSVAPRMNRILNALSYSEGNNISTKKRLATCNSNSCNISSNSSSSSSRNGSSGRRRSTSTHNEEAASESLVAEETNSDAYVPLTNSFQRLRHQLMSDFSIMNRYHSSNSNSVSSLENAAKPFSLRKDSRPQHKQPSKCGDWVRTFPYNAATLHGSRNPLYIKSLVTELFKYRKMCEKIFLEENASDDESLNRHIRKLAWGDHILWSPKQV